MTPKDILKEVAKNGTCEHIKLADCKTCPMGKLKKRPDWNAWFSCYESICGSEHLTDQQQTERYKAKASELLADMALEETLKEDT